jgi:hypothetical protein
MLAVGDEVTDQGRADEAGAAGDENAHGGDQSRVGASGTPS